MLPSSAAAVLVALLLALLSQPKILGLGNVLVAAALTAAPSRSPGSAAPSPSPSPAPSAAPTRPPFNASTMAHLLDIYTAFDGQHWGVPASSTRIKGWDFSRDARTRQYAANPCLDRWSFVTCGANNDSVTGLDLTNATINLSSVRGLPTGLFELTDLTTLVIAHLNDSSRGDAPSTYYTLPSAVGNLRRLETLHISMNKLAVSFYVSDGKSSLNGSLPSTLGELTNLKVLNLALNLLGDSVPSSLGRLKALRSIDLSFNSLESTLPVSFSGLSGITYLDLSHNCKLIPSWTSNEVAVLPSLRHLDLSNTNLTGRSIPNAIGSTTALTYINLEASTDKTGAYTRGLPGTLPSSLGSLKMLRYLKISGHDMLGSIPSELAALPALEYLSLRGHYSELAGSIPSAFGLARSLTSLDLAFNKLTGEIPRELGRLTRLVELDLIGNRLRGSIPAAIGDMKSLTYLSLYSNRLTGPLPDELYGLTGLIDLFLNNNTLSGTISPLVGNLTSLIFLDLARNSFRGQLPLQLGRCQKMQYLSVGDNAFTGPIPDSLCALAIFQFLFAKNNHFTCYPECLRTKLNPSPVRYSIFYVDRSVPSCNQAPLASGYLVTSLFADDNCKELAAETRVMAGQCLRQKHLHYIMKINASELAQGYVTSRFDRYSEDSCSSVLDATNTFPVPRLHEGLCYRAHYDTVIDQKAGLDIRHLNYFYIDGLNGGAPIFSLSPYFPGASYRLPSANTKSTNELIRLLYFNPDPVRSIRVSFVHVNASAYYTTHISSELQGPTSSATAAVATPFVREQGYLVKSAFSQNQTRCELDLAPSQTAIIPAGTCFNFTDGLPYGNPALLSKLFFCRDRHVKYRVFPTPGCCVGNPDSQCMLRASNTLAYGRQCAERYEGVPTSVTNDDVASGEFLKFFKVTHDDDYLLQAKFTDTQFQFQVQQPPHFLPPAVPPDAAEQRLAGINLTHDHFTGFGVDPSANSSWSCVPPLPIGRPLAGLATVTTFRGPRCVASAIQCELRVALGVCYKGKGASSSSSSSSSTTSSSGSYREHYLHPGSWGVLSYDIVKSSFPDTLDCSGRAAPNATTTFLKDTCIADPAKGASYRFEWAGSAAEESYQYQQDEKYSGCNVHLNLTENAGLKGSCRNVVNGTATSGLALADTETQAYAVKTLYSDSRCSPGSMVSEEAHLVGDGTCFALSGNRGSYRTYVSRCGAVAGLSSSVEAPDVISLRYSGPGCEEGKATGYDSSLTGQSVCFGDTNVGAGSGGSFTIRVVFGGTYSSLPPTQLYGYMEMLFKSEKGCMIKDAGQLSLRRAYAPTAMRQPSGDTGMRSCHSVLTFQLDRMSAAVASFSSLHGAESKVYLSSAFIPDLSSTLPASYCASPTEESFAPSDTSFFPLIASDIARIPTSFSRSIVCLAGILPAFLLQLQDQRNQYVIQIFMSVVSLCASLLMLVVIIRMNKYTDAILILLVLTCCQLCYDASFILPFQPANLPMNEYTFGLAVRSLFLTRFFGLACIIMSNYLAFVVAYVIFARRTCPARRGLPYVCGLIFVTSLIITSLLTAYAPQLLDDSKDVKIYANSLLALRGVQIACILFNVIAVSAMYGNIYAQRRFDEKRNKMAGKAQAVKRHAGGDPLLELCKRLAFYPLVQALTQFPVMWDTFAYELDAQGHFPKSDDDFYSSKPYRAYGYVNALLVPSSGLLFAIVFFAFQPGALNQFKLVQRLISRDLLPALKRCRSYLTSAATGGPRGEGARKTGGVEGEGVAEQTSNPIGHSTPTDATATENEIISPQDQSQAECQGQGSASSTEKHVRDLDDDELEATITGQDTQGAGKKETGLADCWAKLSSHWTSQPAGGKDLQQQQPSSVAQTPRLGSIYASQEIEMGAGNWMRNPSLTRRTEASLSTLSNAPDDDESDDAKARARAATAVSDIIPQRFMPPPTSSLSSSSSSSSTTSTMPSEN